MLALFADERRFSALDLKFLIEVATRKTWKWQVTKMDRCIDGKREREREEGRGRRKIRRGLHHLLYCSLWVRNDRTAYRAVRGSGAYHAACCRAHILPRTPPPSTAAQPLQIQRGTAINAGSRRYDACPGAKPRHTSAWFSRSR